MPVMMKHKVGEITLEAAALQQATQRAKQPSDIRGWEENHDSQIEIGRVSVVLAQEKPKDRQAAQFGNIFIAQQSQSA